MSVVVHNVEPVEATIENVTDAARQRRRLLRPIGAGLRLSFVPIFVFIVWTVAAATLGSIAVASPSETFRAVSDGFSAGWLSEALRATLIGTAAAFLVAAVIGLALGFLMGLSRFWGAVLEPPLVWFYAIPKVTLYPIFLLFLGLTVESKVAFAALHGFIPLALFIVSGVRNVRPVYFKVAKVYGLSRWQTIRRVVLPNALPSVVVGLQYCFSLSFIGLVFAELFAATEGTGYELIQAISLHRVPDTFGIALVLVIFALLVNGAFSLLVNTVESRRGVQVRRSVK